MSFAAYERADGQWLMWREDPQGVVGPVVLRDFTDVREVADIVEEDYRYANPPEAESESGWGSFKGSQLLRTGGGALVGAVGGSLLGGIPGVVVGHTALTTLGSSVGSIVGAAGGAAVGSRMKNARADPLRPQNPPQPRPADARQLKNKLLR